MDRAKFFKHFDLLADQPDALAKMRELVLNLAVRGKLVSQKPTDEPADKLLARLKAKHCPKGMAEADLNNVGKKPFDLPRGWTWGRFPELGKFSRGKSRHRPRNEPSLYTDGKYPLVQTGDVARAKGIIRSHTGLYNEKGLAQSKLWPAGTMCITIAANIAETGILGMEACIPDSVVGFIPDAELVGAEYFEFFMRTAKARLQDFAPSTAQKNINMGILESVYVPLPPLAEQRRIVAKVDELMELCDELDQQQQAKHDAETLFQRSALHHLTSARDQASFATSWQRVSNHFDLLHDNPDAITQLHQAILQLAVQGRLGTQNRNDEAASRLIAQARTQWPDRKASERQDFKPEEPPYDLPAGWEWACLDELGNTNPRNEADDKMEVAFTPMKFIAAEYGRPAAFEIRPWSEIKKGFTHFANNDVVLAKITPCFENGKSAVMRGLKNGIGAGTTELHVFRGYDGCVLPDYVLLFLKTSHFIETGVPRMTGSAGQKRVPWDYFANSPFPLPPLAEQKRIVGMVNDLMQQCDALELQLNDSRTLGTQLLDSTIHHLFVKPEESDLAASSGGRKK
jgi:type I restriction enzyme S subunit